MVTIRGLVVSAGAGLLVVVGFAFDVEEFVMVALTAAVLLALSAVSVSWRARVIRRCVQMELRVPATEVGVGQRAVVELHIRNTGRRAIPPVRVEAPARSWTVSYPGLGARRAAPSRSTTSGAEGNAFVVAARALATSLPLAELRPGPATVVSIRVPTGRRGVLTLHAIELWCEDPFRLFAVRAAQSPPAHIMVYPIPDPAEERLPALAVAAGRPSEARPGAVPSPSVAGDDLSSLRPYVPGDRLARLHWPALARTGELVVRDFTSPDSGRLALLVDVRPAAYEAASFESAIGRVAALGSRALADGVAVELYTSAGERLEIPPGAIGRLALLRALALLGPTNPPTSSALRWTGRTQGSAVWAAAGTGDAGMVLVTSDVGSSTALPEPLRRRASVVVVR